MISRLITPYVRDRMQTISCRHRVFKQKCCRLSYGVLHEAPYNPANPQYVRKQISKDIRDGKRWVLNQVNWFVKQSELAACAPESR